MTKLSEFYLIGIEERTQNKDEMAGNGKIPKVWERMFKEDIKTKVNNKIDEDIYAVYSNYESDENGKYDYFVGYKVDSLQKIPDGLKGKKVLSGSYKKLETAKGATYKVVGELWMKVWKMPKEELGGKRAFKTDFEIYGGKAKDPNNSIIELFLGIAQ